MMTWYPVELFSMFLTLFCLLTSLQEEGQNDVESQPLNPNNEGADNIIEAKVLSQEEEEEEDCCQMLIRIIATILCTFLLFIPIFWISCIKVVDQYKRLVHFRLGKVVGGAGGPGIFIMLPCIDEYRLVDLRVKTLDVPRQEMMTKVQ